MPAKVRKCTITFYTHVDAPSEPQAAGYYVDSHLSVPIIAETMASEVVELDSVRELLVQKYGPLAIDIMNELMKPLAP